jgi:hypothetical protein
VWCLEGSEIGGKPSLSYDGIDVVVLLVLREKTGLIRRPSIEGGRWLSFGFLLLVSSSALLCCGRSVFCR